MFASVISQTSLKMGHAGSKTKSLGHILGKIRSVGHIFSLILMKLGQNVLPPRYLSQI